MTNEPGKIAGYTPLSPEIIAAVNQLKQAEERVLRLIEQLADTHAVDPRWFATGRTHIEQGFMAVNRSIMKPTRIEL